jgi:hypothetical protein
LHQGLFLVSYIQWILAFVHQYTIIQTISMTLKIVLFISLRLTDEESFCISF